MDVIPVARDTDVEDVAWALQTADALWKRNERIDAIVWLRRAAQAAGEANDDDRALMLARHAAELSEWLAHNNGEDPPTPSDAPTAVVDVSKSSLGPLDELINISPSMPPNIALPSFPSESDPPPPVDIIRPASDPPTAQQAHAGMLDPWSEPPPPPPARRAAEKKSPLPETLPKIRVADPADEEEVVTSANFVAPASVQQARPDRAPPPVPKKPSPPKAPQPVHAAPASPTSSAEEGDADVALEGIGMAAALKEVRDSQRAPHLPQVEEPAPAPVRAKPPLPKPPLPRSAPKPPKPAPPKQAELVIAKEPEKQAPPERDEVTATEIVVPKEEVTAPKIVAPKVEVAPPKIEPKVEEPATIEAPVLIDAPAPSDTSLLDLSDVDAFADLPDDARAEFASAATMHTLGPDEEVSGFALAYVVRGEVDVAATIVDAPAERLREGAVLRTRGTLGEGLALRLIGVESALVAAWNPESVEAAFKTCPWVEDDLRTAADRMQALVGITMGPIADRLDPSLRQGFTERLEARTLAPGGVLVEKGAPVPGLMLVGFGTIEVVDGDEVRGEITPGDFVFASEILGGGKAHATARAGAEGAVYLFADRKVAQELLVTCPPLLEIFAGM